ncbi:uncharacterized protein LOC123499832 [Portunus trituberculatus]|uniref:uncharacterized protein LOC123499832 n=1 Tax=Portunus trituberculatus TaxID=210409 RepID=UPI001E1CBFC6|nr:uncharacterized protein LOC123499832 [Portunus trituberculatus]
MVHALLLVGAVPLGLLDTARLDPDLAAPGATPATATDDTASTAHSMNWRALLERLGTPQLPDIILSNSQHPANHAKHKPDILLADPASPGAAEANTPSEVKVEVPSSSSSSSSSPSQEAIKSQSSEGRLPLADWLREALSVLRHKNEDKEEEEEDERDGAVGSEEWREAGVLLRKIGDLLDGCSTWSGRGRMTSAALSFLWRAPSPAAAAVAAASPPLSSVCSRGGSCCGAANRLAEGGRPLAPSADGSLLMQPTPPPPPPLPAPPLPRQQLCRRPFLHHV